MISGPDAFQANTEDIWWIWETDSGRQGLHADSGVRITTGKGTITARIPDLQKTVNIPEGTETIEEMAFENIDAEIIFIPDSVKRIGSKAFANNPQLRLVFFPNRDVEMDGDALAGSQPAELWDYTIDDWTPEPISVSTRWQP